MKLQLHAARRRQSDPIRISATNHWLAPTMCPDPLETLVLLEPRPFSAAFQLPFLQRFFVCVETEHAPWPWRFRRLPSQHRFPPRLLAADGRVSKFCENLALIAPVFALYANRCFHLGTRNEKIMRYTAGEHPRTSNKTENREENRKIHHNSVQHCSRTQQRILVAPSGTTCTQKSECTLLGSSA